MNRSIDYVRKSLVCSNNKGKFGDAEERMKNCGKEITGRKAGPVLGGYFKKGFISWA